ncbi:MAG: methanogenesis marker 15 protein [Candidatus Methanomethyliaceae archaeon]|nr:methanogenesis marker 15 protein [Candidatus Methanomethyliaceae archaeon]MDW7970842.1 methanogenesis marker 15 protein [Nitrososphaerota archaeon]
MTGKVRIAQISCGTEYSGIQKEIEKAAEMVGGRIVVPEVDLNDIKVAEEELGFHAISSGLKLMMARAKAIVEREVEVDGVFLTTCFKCAEGALVRSIVRRYIQSKSKIPVVTYSFTERTKAGTLLLRMEALVNIISKKPLFARTKQEGITAGIDSGSTTTKAVIMKDNEIVGVGWLPTTSVLESGKKALEIALKEANIDFERLEAIGVTGYGRRILKEYYKAQLSMEEVSTCSKGALFLCDRQKGDATVIDIGGMDNKAITLYDSIPDSFTVGGVCAGASGRFLETSAKRLGIGLDELGELALKGDYRNVPMNAYCIVFGLQDLVAALASGARIEDVAAAACYSVAEQVFEQQLQEIDIRHPIIQVGSTALIKGLVKAMSDVLSVEVIVPQRPNLIGAVGVALMASGMKELEG